MNAAKDNIYDLVSTFKTCMLTTSNPNGGLHSRPMAVAKISPEGDFYLVSKILSEKVHELQIDPHATLTFQSDPVKHVCLSGQVSISADKSQIRSLWNIFLDTWFENGPEASSVALLQFKPSYAEYWDHSGTKALRYAFECAKSRVTGGTPDIPEPDMHGSCKL